MTAEPQPLELAACPEPGCDAPAEVVDRWTWPSTDGPAVHVATHCVAGHRYTHTED